MATWRLTSGSPATPHNSDRHKIVTHCVVHRMWLWFKTFLPFGYAKWLRTNPNSANDNPPSMATMSAYCTVDTSMVAISQMAMDTLKTAVANLADLLDRHKWRSWWITSKFNNGLPFNLTGAEGERKPINHGFKAVIDWRFSLTAEALKHTMPASVLSFTECHNQHASAYTTWLVTAYAFLNWLEQVAAQRHFWRVHKRLSFRKRHNELDEHHMSGEPANICDEVLKEFEFPS